MATSEADGVWTTFLVEHYWPGVTEATFHEATDAVVGSVERMGLAGAPIRFLHSTLVPADEAGYCVIGAASRELVTEAYCDAGVEFARVVEAIDSVDLIPPGPCRRREDQDGVVEVVVVDVVVDVVEVDVDVVVEEPGCEVVVDEPVVVVLEPTVVEVVAVSPPSSAPLRTVVVVT